MLPPRDFTGVLFPGVAGQFCLMAFLAFLASWEAAKLFPLPQLHLPQIVSPE